MVNRLTWAAKAAFLKIFAGIAIVSVFFSCTIEDTEPDQLQNINSVFVGTQILDFKSAKLSITGPANITGVNSHVRAKLELSSATEFREPFVESSNVMSITLMSVNNGVVLPKFPLANGIYDVYPSTGLPDPGAISTLEGTSFSYGPFIGVGYKPGLPGFNTNHEASTGTIQVVFDVRNSIVKITYDYLTTEGTRVSGSNTLPLNLSSFNP